MMATRLRARTAQQESSSLRVKRLDGGSPTALVFGFAECFGIIAIIHHLPKHAAAHHTFEII